MTSEQTKPRRGRPPKIGREHADTRQALIRSGTAILTEQGFAASGLDAILKQAGVPKGSFYYYFASKEAFGQAILENYASFFAHKLDKCLLDENLPALQRISAFVEDATRGMAKYAFTRGCLVGNLGQEVACLPGDYRQQLKTILHSWEQRMSQCLQLAQRQGTLSPQADCDALAGYFWAGWEGAVMRAKLNANADPLANFIRHFLAGLPQ
ncbi:MAG: TetR/AcrR family transcriptional regulator [Rouxiella aceris]|uniref:acrylate utilization transcriptional regulator AcuR n=1 Tax=Rouxiella aceris TaxID=2703884 RepID=UPI00283F4F71|nr:TetR/AcrR family transcriptional regulator [Rouxiella aceris]MDR3430340.1 TetR/AcrR family transcriptional regulator [Rouxiella aceris]